MNHLYVTKSAFVRSLLILFFSLSAFVAVMAQAPTSFTYPSPVVYIAHVSNVFLSPTVAGSVTTYSLPSPQTLPSGLSFNTNTGVISGIPVAALATTTYTVVATNSFGTATTTFTMTVTNNYLETNYSQLHFGGSGVTVTHPLGTGTSTGDITVFHNIAKFSGQDIDCIVTTKQVTNVDSWYAFDQNASSGDNFSSNSADYFSPQVDFGSGGGSVAFDFQFILGGTYNSTTKKGTNVVLQNVKLNTYDIDGNGGSGSNQYNEFGGFNTSELGSSNPTITASYNAATGLTKFLSTRNTNSSVVTADATRVRVTYSNMSSFSIVVGANAGNDAYFFLDFSSGPAFSSTVTTAPSVDLNTDVVGVTNEEVGCGVSLSFTKSAQTNIASPGALSELQFSYLASDIKNAADEKLVINGSTAGTSTHSLNFASASTSNVTVGGVNYSIAKSTTTTVSGVTTSKITFTKSGGGTFTLLQAEALIDALRYSNTASVPTAGERKFTVNVLNTTFKSPDAVFTADVNCVSISGNIWHDANGLLGTSDINTISANSSTGQFAANFVYAILVNPLNNHVIASQGIAAGGAFSFGTVTPGSYILYVSKNNQNAGTTFTAATYPIGGYVSVGENLGADAGNDLLVDGKLSITVGSTAVTNANFGLEVGPSANAVSLASQPNPGGIQKVTVPTLDGLDLEDGTLNGGTGNEIKILSLPSNGILYYNGVAVDLASPVITNYNPAWLTVDPDHGDVTISFKYQEVDAAGLTSADATVTMPFTEFSISGTVYHDVDGTTNNQIDGTPVSSPDGAQLYANLVLNGLVVGTDAIYNDGTYLFQTVSGLQTNTNFQVVISTVEGVIGTSTGTTSSLPATWVHTADGSGAGDVVANGELAVNVLTSTISTGLDFGIEILPTPGSGSNSALNPGGTNSETVPANTFTIGTASGDLDGTVTAIKIKDFPTGASSFTINGTLYTVDGNGGSTIWPSTGISVATDGDGNPVGSISVDPIASGITSVDIPFVAVDNAGKESTATGHAIMNFTDLTLSGVVWNDADGSAMIDGAETTMTSGNIWVNLVNPVTHNVLKSVPLSSSGSYLFEGLDAITNYQVILSVSDNSAASLTSPSVPSGWFATGINLDGNASISNQTNSVDVATLKSNITLDFGLERKPVSDSKSFSVSISIFSPTPPSGYPKINNGATEYLTIATSNSGLTGGGSLSGSDPEDCATAGSCNTGKTFVVATINPNTKIYYNFAPGGVNEVGPGTSISNYDPSKMIIYGLKGSGDGGSPFGFTYSLVDAAGKISDAVTYTIVTSPLPVTLVSFDAQKEGNTVQLKWSTTEEVNSEYFDVQHSVDATSWNSVGIVASHGDTKVRQNYAFSHAAPSAGANYYRLKMVDRDATFAYSRIRTIEFANEIQVKMYPNPVSDKLTIESAEWSSIREIEIISTAGVVNYKAAGNNLNNQIDVKSLNSGVYLIKLGHENGTATFHKVLVTR